MSSSIETLVGVALIEKAPHPPAQRGFFATRLAHSPDNDAFLMFDVFEVSFGFTRTRQ